MAVIRLSGDEAKGIAEQFVRPLTERRPTCTPFVAGGEKVDEVVACYFKSPHSYTGDDTVEISCHGSLYIQQTILQYLVKAGARIAEPGEFTRRAFINGKLNLSQAEAVADLVNSTTQASNQLALNQLRGTYQLKLKAMRQELLDLTALLELELDFSQEDVQFADRSRLMALAKNIEDDAIKLVESFRSGNAVKNGVKVAIIGAPNAGKSTLLNTLLNDDRAIVSDIPGTTRDTIEDTAIIDGILVRFIDTAGLRHSEDPIEQAGIERSLKAAREADIIIEVVDSTAVSEATPIQLPESHAVTIEALNKCDLFTDSGSRPPEADRHARKGISQTIEISAKEGTGLDTLKQAIVAPFKERGDGAMLSNLRHYEAMKHLLEAIRQVIRGLEDEVATDLVAIDLRDAIYHIGSITGEVTTDEILGNIFSKFCVGK